MADALSSLSFGRAAAEGGNVTPGNRGSRAEARRPRETPGVPSPWHTRTVEAVHETGADLVVMASHIPGIADAIWPSHGGRLASHADVSVFVVR